MFTDSNNLPASQARKQITRFLRILPLTSGEEFNYTYNKTSFSLFSTTQEIDGNPNFSQRTTFNFDRIFHLENNNKIYSETIKPTIDKLLKNQTNAVFIGLGELRSGKKNCLLGDANSVGLFSLLMRDLTSVGAGAGIKVSFLEIIYDKAVDLLKPASKLNEKQLENQIVFPSFTLNRADNCQNHRCSARSRFILRKFK